MSELEQAEAKLAALREQIAETKAEEKAVVQAKSEAARLNDVLVDIERREADLASAQASLAKAKGDEAPAAPAPAPAPAAPAPPRPQPRPPVKPEPDSDSEEK